MGGITLLLCLVVVELLLRLVGYGRPDVRPDPFYGFEGTPPAFRLETGPDGQPRRVPRPGKVDPTQSFAARKPDGTFRIFVFGGSTTWGQPYGPRGAFGRWLGDALAQRYPHVRFEVINAGVQGFGAARVYPLLREAAAYDPDLFVVYTGQNEFRDATFHYWELTRGPFEARVVSTLLSSRAAYLLYEAKHSLQGLVFGPRETSYGGSLVASLLETPFSADTFHSFDYYTVPELVEMRADEGPAVAGHGVGRRAKWVVKRLLRAGDVSMPREQVLSLFRTNLDRMVRTAGRRGIPILLLNKAQNPKERNVLYAATYATSGADARSRAVWEEHYERGLDALREADAGRAWRELELVSTLFDGSPDPLLQLYLGLSLERLGRYEQAREAYERRLSADHHDLRRLVADVAAERHLPLIDVQRLFEASAANGIVGYENFFVDNVHMTLAGYRTIGGALADLVVSLGLVPATAADPAAVRPGVAPAEADPPELDTAEVDTALAWAAFQQGELEAALERGERAIARDPDEIQAHLLLGYVYARLGRLDDARRAWETIGALYRGM